MRTDRAVTRMSSDRVAMRPIVDRLTDAQQSKAKKKKRKLKHGTKMLNSRPLKSGVWGGLGWVWRGGGAFVQRRTGVMEHCNAIIELL